MDNVEWFELERHLSIHGREELNARLRWRLGDYTFFGAARSQTIDRTRIQRRRRFHCDLTPVLFLQPLFSGVGRRNHHFLESS